MHRQRRPGHARFLRLLYRDCRTKGEQRLPARSISHFALSVYNIIVDMKVETEFYAVTGATTEEIFAPSNAMALGSTALPPLVR